MKNHLHEGAKWQFRINAYIVMLFLSFFLSWFIIPFLAVFSAFINLDNADPTKMMVYLFTGALGFTIVYLILMIVLAEIYSRMSYNRWFYEFTQDQLKLERGIIWKRYSNVPYERIQNVDITRGIVARILGFSSVNIQTAGYSGAGQLSEGYIPALSQEEAEKVREFLMKKISKKGQGI